MVNQGLIMLIKLHLRSACFQLKKIYIFWVRVLAHEKQQDST